MKLAFLASLVFALGAQAQSPAKIVAFGDSLSDTHNYFEATGGPGWPYWNGRFCDGPLWIEELARIANVAPANLDVRAYGGASMQEMRITQVMPFVGQQTTLLPADTLVTLWAGSIDFFGFALFPQSTPEVFVAGLLTEMQISLTAVLSVGARRVVVPNLPDLSRTPAFTSLGTPAQLAQLRGVVIAYNDGLARMCARFEQTWGADIVSIDTFALMSSIADAPASFGFGNVTDQALDPSTGDIDFRPWRHLFWDGVHPTRRGHTAMLSRTLAALELPFGDLDGDGALSSVDVALALTRLGPCAPGERADLDRNGVVDLDDVKWLQELALFWP